MKKKELQSIDYIKERLNGHIGQEYAKPQGRITVIK